MSRRWQAQIDEYEEDLCKVPPELVVKQSTERDLDSDSAGEVEPVSEEAIASAFGPKGSWCVIGAAPRGNFWRPATEQPFSVRGVRPTPKIKKSHAKALLSEWGVGVLNSKGCKGRDRLTVGQDNYCVARLQTGWEVFGVFDGHGSVGHWPANRAARTVPYYLQSAICTAMLGEGRAAQALRHALSEAQDDLEMQAARDHIDVDSSGCTASVALLHPSREAVWVATVGDSRACLMTSSGVLLKETHDHKPSRQDEIDRIEQAGGVVRCTQYPDGGMDWRVYVKGTDYPGIAVSRSMGDCSVKGIGVSAEPEVVRWDLQGQDAAYLVVATDGVWEFLSSAEVAAFISASLNSGASLEMTMEGLVERSRAAWSKKAGGQYCDDITAVVAPVRGPTAPQWDAEVDDDGTSDDDGASSEGGSEGGCGAEGERVLCYECSVM